ncbi:MAG: hypothetical protein EXR92_00170 [Gemmatimonadetes bacterium]|nr:hypothetical protein [Gemmatimonadota bacterium]
MKLDVRGLYAINFGVFTGTRFISGWDNTWWGLAEVQRDIAFKALYASVEPIDGIEAQLGGLYLVKGESTEFTTYDDDGYVMGERISLRRPNELLFDEISATGAYFTGDPGMISVGRRVSHIDETNYWHFLVRKAIGGRGGVSADFSSENDRRTWRQAIRINLPELKFVDSAVFEQYERTGESGAYGFSITFAKQLTAKLSLNQFGYARIDPDYGPLNADRFNIGNRAFVMATYVFSPEFTASLFITRAVGDNGVLPQRILSNAVLAYNALPALRRTGYF